MWLLAKALRNRFPTRDLAVVGRLGWTGLVLCMWAPEGAHAQAGDAACADPRVHVEGTLDSRWLAPVVQLCEDLKTMTDLDPSAALRIVPVDDDIVVEATLGDGRHALRRVHATDSLTFTVEALLVVPSTPLPPVGPVAVPVLPASESVSASASGTGDSKVVAAVPQQKLGVELGAAIVGHVARAPTYLSGGLEMYGGVRPGAWLLGLALRWYPIQDVVGYPTPSGFETDSVGAGFVVARRALRARSATLDLGLNTFLMTESQSFRTGSVESTDTDADMRVGLLARTLLGHSAWRWALSLQAEVSPLRLSRARRVAPSLPTLPSWSLGVGIGAAWEEQ